MFKIAVPAGTFTPGECGREYELCITLGSRDCCGKVGFVFGSCHEYTITVSPPETDEGGIHPLEAGQPGTPTAERQITPRSTRAAPLTGIPALMTGT